MGGVSDADFVPRYNTLWRASRYRGQRPLLQDFLGKANFKILGFTLACKVNGVIKSYKSLNGLVSSEMKKAISQLKKGEQFTLENIKIYTRKGVEKTIPKQVYQLID